MPSAIGCPPQGIDSTDRLALQWLRSAATEVNGHSPWGYRSSESDDACHRLPASDAQGFLAVLAATERFVWQLNSSPRLSESHPVSWDPAAQCRLVIRVQKSAVVAAESRSTLARPSESSLDVTVRLLRDGEEVDLAAVVLPFADGLVLFADRLCRLRPSDAGWITGLIRSGGAARVPVDQLDAFLDSLLVLPEVPELEFDPALDVTVSHGQPTGRLELLRPRFGSPSEFEAELWIKYDDQVLRHQEDRSGLWNRESRRVVLRDMKSERRLLEMLAAVARELFPGMQFAERSRVWIRADKLAQLVAEVSKCGWEVVAHGKVMRSGGQLSVSVKSRQDWFDVEAELEFDGLSASLPSLLAALRRKENFVTLGDGSQGLLPEAWLDQLRGLTEMGAAAGEGLQFHRSQALLLDAMLAGQENVTLTRDFSRLCGKLRSFSGIKPVKVAGGFRGELRPYQAEALSWFRFLRDFDFGGCLADDMGLGKTVQVLALLQSRRRRRLRKHEARLPSLVVVPKSLVFNWICEAQRFAPELRILNHTGMQRERQLTSLRGVDVILTTYGTLRRDIEVLADVQYDYAILDEAQAIKNSASQTAKVCRLIKARHRLAMTGTPVENHLGELWSLLEFLNPGLWGKSEAFRQLLRRRQDDDDSLELLRQSVRPFILRRTKQQVLSDLPEKTEQTIYCEMTTRQQKLYDELRDYYRLQISKKVDQLGNSAVQDPCARSALEIAASRLRSSLIGRQASGGSEAADSR